MSTRERWIVYPLLFLTLGIALRNQFLPTNLFKAMDLHANEIKANDFTAHTILCDGLVVRDKASCSKIVADQLEVNNLLKSWQFRTADAEIGKLSIADTQGRPVIILGENRDTKSGMIQTLHESGAPQVEIFSNEFGGIVKTSGHLGQVWLGHEAQFFGVFGQFNQIGQPPFPLTPLAPFQSQLPTPKISPTPQINPPEEKKEELKKEEPKPENKK
jgi:hypothetical protein